MIFTGPAGIALRGCQPRDLIDQALSLAEYLGEPEHLTDEASRARAKATSSQTRNRTGIRVTGGPC